MMLQGTFLNARAPGASVPLAHYGAPYEPGAFVDAEGGTGRWRRVIVRPGPR